MRPGDRTRIAARNTASARYLRRELFPRLMSRGPIEAFVNTGESPVLIPFPRLMSRGPIEALC